VYKKGIKMVSSYLVMCHHVMCMNWESWDYIKEKWYLHNHFVTTFSLILILYFYSLSLFFSPLFLINKKKKKKKLSLKIILNGCSNITALYREAVLTKHTWKHVVEWKKRDFHFVDTWWDGGALSLSKL